MKPILLGMIALATPVAAQSPDWRKAQPISIRMTDDGFIPRSIPVRQGAPYVLRIVNRSDKGHNLTQEAFFDQAQVAGRDRNKIHGGKIVLASGEGMTVRFRAPVTRRGGTYQFSSTTLGDAGKDYTGVFLIR
ncbi:hypothetical protein ABIC16_002955 [Sphingomonas sp. PvP055]|uniref:cupredoxin domain-containing protein n=1 Tax=Sphingomonas sp. PvP055 TaxID=3156391 RepID=UPI00339A15F5